MLFTRERSRSGRGGGQAVKLLLAAFSEGEARLRSRDQNYEKWYRIESLVILFDTCSITGQPFASGFKLDYRQVRYHTYIPRVPLRLVFLHVRRYLYKFIRMYIYSMLYVYCTRERVLWRASARARNWCVYGIEGIRRRNEGTETRSAKPEAPYNTVASRIRNLLLIIMLSILTRHSYLVSLLISFASPRYRRVCPLFPICRGLPRRGNRGKYRFKMIPDR